MNISEYGQIELKIGKLFLVQISRSERGPHISAFVILTFYSNFFFDKQYFLLKGVAQPYLSLWDSFWELQKSDKYETFPNDRANWVGDFVFFKVLKQLSVQKL